MTPGRQAISVPATRILVVADMHLIGEAVRMALVSRGAAASIMPAPRNQHELRRLRQWVLVNRQEIGLVLCQSAESRSANLPVSLIQHIPLRWLVLTAAADPGHWGRILAAGAVGVLPMHASLNDLLTAVNQVVSGAPAMEEAVRAHAMETWHIHEMSRHDLVRKLRQLTPRERHVLGELARGRSVAEIASAGGVSVLTVRTQVKSILRKLGVSSQLAAVAHLREATDNIPQQRRPRPHPSHSDAV